MERAYWLAWSKIPGIGSVLLKRLHQHFDSLAQAWSATAIDLLGVEGLGAQTVDGIINARKEIDPLTFLAKYEKQNQSFWTPADSGYPQLLLEIPDSPALLHYLGNRSAWSEPNTVAIVGTRYPTGYGRTWARKIGRALAENNFIVVSGLADGIDTEAHRGCLDAKGHAIAVVGTGVDRVYPQRNQQLYEQIQESGLILSEYSAGTGPDRMHFPQRNRIIAGLSRATIVIEAPTKSGALITAHQANDYGRDVFALPGSLETEQSKGCLNLINRGAQIILGIDELIAALGAMPQLDHPSHLHQVSHQLTTLDAELTKDLSGLEPLQKQVLEILQFGHPINFDYLVEQLQQPSGTVSGALLQLELYGVISQLPGMRYQRLV